MRDSHDKQQPGRKNPLCRLCCSGSCGIESPHSRPQQVFHVALLSSLVTFTCAVGQGGLHVQFLTTKMKKIRTTDEGRLRRAIRQRSRSCKHFLRITVVESSRVDRPT